MIPLPAKSYRTRTQAVAVPITALIATITPGGGEGELQGMPGERINDRVAESPTSRDHRPGTPGAASGRTTMTPRYARGRASKQERGGRGSCNGHGGSLPLRPSGEGRRPDPALVEDLTLHLRPAAEVADRGIAPPAKGAGRRPSNSGLTGRNPYWARINWPRSETRKAKNASATARLPWRAIGGFHQGRGDSRSGGSRRGVA